MATLAAIATGSATDFTTAGTWGLVDSTTFQGGENTAIQVPQTTYGTSARTQSLTPGAIEVSGIGVKISAVAASVSGTISVHLANVSDHSEISGTAVTTNLSDVVATATTTDQAGGWMFFEFASPVTLPGTAIECEIKKSDNVSFQIWRHDATAGNFSYYLRTTTTQAPTTGDDLIITKEWTSAGTGTAAVVTMNNIDTTDYGSTPTAANSLITPGISICNGGTLSYGTTAATNYNLKISNSIIVHTSFHRYPDLNQKLC